MATLTKKAAAAAELAEQCRIVGLPMPTHELVFHPTRKWRFDCAWPELFCEQKSDVYFGVRGVYPGPKLALEIDGGVFLKDGGGRHNRGAGYRNDTEKLNEAIILGWYVMRCLLEQISQGVVITWIERFMLAHHVVLPKSTQPRRNYEPTQEVRRPDPITARTIPSREYLDVTGRAGGKLSLPVVRPKR